MTFTELGLAPALLRAVEAAGYQTPTPIQEQAIPFVLQGTDLLGCAQTGTGKTAAFLLPLLHHLIENPNTGGKAPRALVLAPTRELAQQIADNFQAYAKGTGLHHATVYGGVSPRTQISKLRVGIDVLIATPGRLLDLVNQRYIDLRAIQYLVLDEADRMLDMGFLPDIRRILKLVPTDRQTMLFSATLAPAIRELAGSLLQNPAEVTVEPAQKTTELIEQLVYFVSHEDKKQLIKDLLAAHEIKRALVFTRTKHGADRLAKHLATGGFPAQAIHGDKTQAARQKALDRFKEGKLQVLVATDVAARGIDVDDLTHVFNYDLPEQSETYVHRIGRTGRAGSSGQALSFCSSEERPYLMGITRLMGLEIPVVTDHPYALNLKPVTLAPPPKKEFQPRNASESGGYGARKPFVRKGGQNDRQGSFQKKRGTGGGYGGGKHVGNARRKSA